MVSSKSLLYVQRVSKSDKVMYLNFQDTQAREVDFSHRRKENVLGEGTVAMGQTRYYFLHGLENKLRFF